MTSFIRKHFNSATVIALLAMIFAMSGGAFAASGGLGASGGHHGAAVASAAKKKSKGKGKSKATGKAGPRGPKGETGPAGATGLAGATGATGATGAVGKEGPAGKEGKEGPEGKPGAPGGPGKEGESVTVEKLNADEGGCAEGGTELSDKSGSATACNGKSAGGTLEAEKSEMGTWSMEVNSPPYSKEEGYSINFGEAAITFAEPLPPADYDRVNIYFLPKSVRKTEQCPGDKSEESAPGTLCIYSGVQGMAENPSLSEKFTPTYPLTAEYGYYRGQIIEGLVQSGGVGEYEIGALITFAQSHPEAEAAGGYASGTWILTAPEEA